MGSVSAKTKFVVTKGENGAPDVTEDRSVTVNYDMPTDLDGLVGKFGKDVVYQQAEAALVIALQSGLRRQITTGKSQDEAQKFADTWSPETRAAVQRKSAAEKVDDLIGGLSVEDRKALIAKLKAAA